MSEAPMPIAIQVREAPVRGRPSVDPETFASVMADRVKSPLGDLFGLRNFVINLVKMSPGSPSALRRLHSKPDEAIQLEVGDRAPGNAVRFSDDDLAVEPCLL